MLLMWQPGLTTESETIRVHNVFHTIQKGTVMTAATIIILIWAVLFSTGSLLIQELLWLTGRNPAAHKITVPVFIVTGLFCVLFSTQI